MRLAQLAFISIGATDFLGARCGWRFCVVQVVLLARPKSALISEVQLAYLQLRMKVVDPQRPVAASRASPVDK
jgi:hypothetical protein